MWFYTYVDCSMYIHVCIGFVVLMCAWNPTQPPLHERLWPCLRLRRCGQLPRRLGLSQMKNMAGCHIRAMVAVLPTATHRSCRAFLGGLIGDSNPCVFIWRCRLRLRLHGIGISLLASSWILPQRVKKRKASCCGLTQYVPYTNKGPYF